MIEKISIYFPIKRLLIKNHQYASDLVIPLSLSPLLLPYCYCNITKVTKPANKSNVGLKSKEHNCAIPISEYTLESQ